MHTLSLFKRKNSSYWWYSVYKDGVRYQRSAKKHNLRTDTHNKKEATEIIGQYLNESLAQLNIDTETKTLLWFKADILKRLEYENKRDGTIELYRIAFDNLISVFGENTHILSIKKSDVAKLQYEMRKRGVSGAYINLVCRHLRASFERLCDDEIIVRNPFKKFKKYNEDTGRKKSMTRDEVARFLIEVDKKKEAIRRLIYIYLFTGRRRTEILEINRSDVDLVRNVIRVMNVKDKYFTKQYIEIPKAIREDIEWFMYSNQSPKPFKILKPNSITRIVKNCIRDAGLPESLHLHSLRHTFVSLALESGENMWALKKWLGHSTISVTEVYDHGVPEKSIDIGIKNS